MLAETAFKFNHIPYPRLKTLRGAHELRNELIIGTLADQSERSLLFEPYRCELLLHPYRLLDSLSEV